MFLQFAIITFISTLSVFLPSETASSSLQKSPWNFSVHVDALTLSILTVKLKPRPHISRYFLIRNFFFPDSKIFPSTHTGSLLKSNLPVHTLPGFTLVLKTSQGNRGNRACTMNSSVAILRIDFMVRNWAQSCYVIWEKKNSGFGVHMVPDSHRIQKHPLWRSYSKCSEFASEFTWLHIYVWMEGVSGRKKLRIQKYLDTCGQGLIDLTLASARRF